MTLLAASSALAQTTRTVTAVWDANTDSLTRGYIVYYGTGSGSYQWSHDAGTQTSTPLTLNVGAQYFFVVRAYDANAALGPASNEASFDLRVAAPTATITATLQNATTALVTWSTTNAVSATINGVGVALSGSSSVPVSATTTFTIVATNSAGATVTRSATVTVTAPAPTATFTATLQNNTTAVLNWSTTNATAVTINGTGVAVSGSASVPVSASTTFTLVATGAGGSVTRTASVTVTPPSNPAPTATFTATLQNNTTAVLNWSTTNATTVTINGAAVTVNGSTSVPVSASTTFTLIATGAGGSVTRTASVTVTPPVSTVPNAPTNMTSTVSGSLARLAWRAPTSGPAPSSYRLDVGTKSGTSNISNGLDVGNVLAVTGNLPRGRYYARARAVNSAGVSAYSPETNFWVGKKLVSPTSLTVRWTGTTATFTWMQPVSDSPDAEAPAGYVLEAGTAPGDASISVPLGNVTSFSVPVPAGTYYVRVRGVTGWAESDATQELVLTPPGGPGAPRSLTATGSSATVTLRWQAPSSGGAPTAYQIEAGSAPGLANLAVVQVGNVTSFSTPIPPGTYYVRVRALNGVGTGPVSNEVIVRR